MSTTDSPHAAQPPNPQGAAGPGAAPKALPTLPVHRNALSGGTVLQEYRIESVLGAGGFGITYLCRDAHLDKLVAIKEYFPSDLVVRALDGGVLTINDDDGEPYRWGLERFLQEARTLARFSHPHIVRVNRYFEANATGYMVMDYEAGQSLAQALKIAGPMDEARTRQLLNPLLDGLQAVHDTGFLHRDIKPSNVFLRSAGSPVLLDFGSARQALGGSTRTLTSIITPGFAPLEQYSGDGNQGPWTDIYALGGVMLRSLSGDNPPDAVSRLKRDSIPERLAQLRGRVSPTGLLALEWALAIDERGRPQTVAEWRRALEGRSRPPVAARPAAPTTPAPPTPAARPSGRTSASTRPISEEGSFAWRWVGAGAAALLVFGAVNLWMPRSAASDAATRATAPTGAAPMSLPTPVAAVAAAPIPAQDATPAPQLATAEPNVPLRPPAGGQPMPPPQLSIEPANPGPPAPPGQRLPPTPEAAAVRGPDPMAPRKQAEFRRLDANGDGFLSPQEMQSAPRLSDEFRLIDRNADGRISLDELMDYRPLRPPSPGGRIEVARPPVTR